MSRKTSPAMKRNGFTIIECLAAMLLVAIVLPVAMQVASLSMRSSTTARHRLEASQLGEAKLEEIMLQSDTLALGTSGTFGDDWPDYSWQLASTQGPFGTIEMTLTVIWEQRGQEQSLEMSCLARDAMALPMDSSMDSSMDAALDAGGGAVQ